jgi:hypothetical protein
MNINEFSNGVQGAQQGVFLGQFDRVDELNTRMQDRHFSPIFFERSIHPSIIPRSFQKLNILLISDSGVKMECSIFIV